MLAEVLPGKVGGEGEFPREPGQQAARGPCLGLTLAAVITRPSPWALAGRDIILGRGLGSTLQTTPHPLQLFRASCSHL